jgi:hypothetical protein
VKDDPLRRDLEIELRALRTKPGPLGLERVGDAEVLTDVVGRGSVERAYGILIDMLAQHGSDPEGDVRAYFETCGVDLPGDDLNMRLDAYSERHFVNPRTGLRRSDRGATRLSFILRDALQYERPWGYIHVLEKDRAALVSVSVEVFHNALWRRPRVEINGEHHDRPFILHDSKTDDLFTRAEERFASIPLRESSDRSSLLEVEVYWVMPVWPIWMIGSLLETPKLYTTLTSERHSGASVQISQG